MSELTFYNHVPFLNIKTPLRPHQWKWHYIYGVESFSKLLKLETTALFSFHFHTALIEFPITLNSVTDICGISFSSVVLLYNSVSALTALLNKVKCISSAQKIQSTLSAHKAWSCFVYSHHMCFHEYIWCTIYCGCLGWPNILSFFLYANEKTFKTRSRLAIENTDVQVHVCV